jgi:hypothetical protein
MDTEAGDAMSRSKTKKQETRRQRRLINQLDRPFMSQSSIISHGWGGGIHRSDVSKEIRQAQQNLIDKDDPID